MEFKYLCVTWGSKHTVGHWLWSAVHSIEIVEVLLVFDGLVHSHTSKSVLGCTCILESCRTEMRSRKSFSGVECCRSLRLPISSPSLTSLSRRCKILSFSQCCMPPQPVMGIALLLTVLTLDRKSIVVYIQQVQSSVPGKWIIVLGWILR
jgi:hypothetical protein